MHDSAVTLLLDRAYSCLAVAVAGAGYLVPNAGPTEITSNRSSRALYDKRISQEVEGEALGDEFAGYVSAENADC